MLTNRNADDFAHSRSTSNLPKRIDQYDRLLTILSLKLPLPDLGKEIQRSNGIDAQIAELTMDLGIWKRMPQEMSCTMPSDKSHQGFKH